MQNEIIETEYITWISDLKKRYQQSQIKAAVKVNSERNLRYMRQMFELFSNSATTCGKNEDDILSISEYELKRLYPVDFKSSLPTIAEIESELEKSEGLDK